MNKIRRKKIQQILEKVEELLSEIEDVKGEEEEYRDNIPENLQSSMRYELAEDACNALENAYCSLDDARDQLEEASEI